MDDVVIVGGGPSGLAAAYEATGHGASVTVFEKLEQVGGLARTLSFHGNRFDVGPHRFFTKNREVMSLFETVVAEEMIRVDRLTRIFCDNKYFNYPLTPFNALFGVGVGTSAKIIASYAVARTRATLQPGELRTFEDWVVDRFGRRLHETFFKTYTEKVWGIPCTQIGADWAAQRIKGLSLRTAAMNALFKPKSKTIKTLVDEFVYPRHGSGQLYERMAAIVRSRGGKVETAASVRRIRRDGMQVRAVTIRQAPQEIEYDVSARQFLVSAPLTEIIEMIDPPPPAEIVAASRSLRYRNHLCVNLVVEGRPFPDTWIYVHSRDVRAARIANYANFSREMASSADLSPMTVEYFAFTGDELWQSSDEALIERAKRELSVMGIVHPDRVLAGFVLRSDKAYPVIEIGYQRHIALIKEWLDGFANLLPIGRSGMFKYNNQDHAMMTGLLAARSVLAIQRFDPWLVNIDAEYHEAGRAS